MVDIRSLSSSIWVPASGCGQIGGFDSKLNKVKHLADSAVGVGCISSMTPWQSAYILLKRGVIIPACDSLFGKAIAVLKSNQVPDDRSQDKPSVSVRCRCN